MTSAEITARLEYLRAELRAERISQSELIALQGLVEYIDPGDVELLEAAGVPEHADPELVGGPVDTIRTTADADGIWIQQLDDGVAIPDRRVHLTPDDALGLFHTLMTEIRSFAYPELIVSKDENEDGELVATMSCPRCGVTTQAGQDMDAAVNVQDVDLRHTGGFFQGTVELPELSVYYDSSSNYEGFVTCCNWCGDPVSVPGNVTEVE